MRLHLYEGKKVKIVCDNEKTYFGKVMDYIYPEDNEPEGEIFVLRTVEGILVEFRREEIKEIEIEGNHILDDQELDNYGRLTEPMPSDVPGYNFKAMRKYCEENGKELSDLTEKEIELFRSIV